MITFDKLKNNLQLLQESLPKKPSKYSAESPKTIAESLKSYANQRTVNLYGINVYNYNEHAWPVPLYVNNADIKIGFMNNIFYRKQKVSMHKGFRRLNPKNKTKTIGFWKVKVKPWDWVGIPILRNIIWNDSVAMGVIEMFEANQKLCKSKLLDHPYLVDWKRTIEEIFSCYKRGFWASCIYTIFPMLDFITRKVLKTENLRKDIQTICKLFRQIGIGQEETDVFMAVTNAVMVWHKMREGQVSPVRGKALTEKGYSYSLNMIGSALSSFLQFSNRYYGYFKIGVDEADPLNRHAILHGSQKNFSTKANVDRLVTYLYLIIELEPILATLLNENS